MELLTWYGEISTVKCHYFYSSICIYFYKVYFRYSLQLRQCWCWCSVRQRLVAPFWSWAQSIFLTGTGLCSCVVLCHFYIFARSDELDCFCFFLVFLKTEIPHSTCFCSCLLLTHMRTYFLTFLTREKNFLPDMGFEAGLSCCKVNMLTTTPLCSPWGSTFY